MNFFSEYFKNINNKSRLKNVIKESINIENKLKEAINKNSKTLLLKNTKILIPVFDNLTENLNNKNIFINKFNKFTGNYFVNIKWNNMLVYGDSIFFNLIKKNLIDKINYLEIKIIIYGLNESKYLEKINYLFNFFQKKIPNELNLCKVNNFIIIFSNYPYKNIKINLKRFKSKKEAIINIKSKFESICFDGDNIITLPKTHYLTFLNNNIIVNKEELIKYNKAIDKLKLSKYEINKLGLSEDENNSSKLLILNQNYNINLIKQNKLNFYNILNTIPFGKEFNKEYIFKFIELNNYSKGYLKDLYKYKKIDKINNKIIYTNEKLLENSNEYLINYFNKNNYNNYYINNELLSNYLIKNNKINLFKNLMKNNFINLNKNGLNGFFPIHIACKFGFIEFVEILYKYDDSCINKKDINYNITPIFLSIIFNYSNIFIFLWKLNNIIKNQIWITKNNTFSIIELIVMLDRRNIFIFLLKNTKKELINKDFYYACIKYNNFNLFKIINEKIHFEEKVSENIFSYSLEKYKNNEINKEFILFIINNKNKIHENDNNKLLDIIKTFDYELIKSCIDKKFNINHILKDNIMCLNIIRDDIRKINIHITNKESSIKYSIWRSNMIKKYIFLRKEFYYLLDEKKDSFDLNNFIINLKKIERLLIDNDAKYNNNEKILLPHKINYNLFSKDEYINNISIVELFNNIWNKNTKEVRKYLINNKKNIKYADIFLNSSNRSCMHLIIEKKLKNILILFLDIIFEQCNDGMYNYITKNKEFIQFNKELENDNKYSIIFNFLIKSIFNKKNKELKNIFHLISDNKSYDCLEILLNNKNIIKNIINKELFNSNILLYNIKNYNIGFSCIILNNITKYNNISEKNLINNVLVEVIKYSNIKLFVYLINNKDYNIDLNFKDNYNNNLIHLLFNKNYNIVKTSLILKLLNKHNCQLMYQENIFGFTPFNNICYLDNVELLKNIFTLDITYNEYDERGLNFIHYSIINNSKNIFNYLLKTYPKILKIRTKKELLTPLMLCIIHNRIYMAKEIYNISELNSTDIYGNTNYHYLVMYSRYNMINFIDNHNETNKVRISPNEYIIRKLIISLYNNDDIDNSLKLYENINRRSFKINFQKMNTTCNISKNNNK